VYFQLGFLVGINAMLVFIYSQKDSNSTAYFAFLFLKKKKKKKEHMFFWKQLRHDFAKKMCGFHQSRVSMTLRGMQIGLHLMITAGMLLLDFSSFCRCAPHGFLILCFLCSQVRVV
jgi:hypothetical protein